MVSTSDRSLASHARQSSRIASGWARTVEASVDLYATDSFHGLDAMPLAWPLDGPPRRLRALGRGDGCGDGCGC